METSDLKLICQKYGYVCQVMFLADYSISVNIYQNRDGQIDLLTNCSFQKRNNTNIYDFRKIDRQDYTRLNEEFLKELEKGVAIYD